MAYVADGQGRCHALRCEDGHPIWSKTFTAHSFESKPLLWEGSLIAGAWDGFLYSVQLATGDLQWSSWSPKGQQGTKSRYYGAADVSPLICDGSLFATDRGWVLGRYSLGGEFDQVLLTGVVAISSGAEQRALYAKMLNNRLVKIDTQGKVLWDIPAQTGRAPHMPVEVGSRVALLSDTGILSLFDAGSGERLLEYSISPRLFCLSGIGTDGDNTLVAADMDGLITRIELNG